MQPLKAAPSELAAVPYQAIFAGLPLPVVLFSSEGQAECVTASAAALLASGTGCGIEALGKAAAAFARGGAPAEAIAEAVALQRVAAGDGRPDYILALLGKGEAAAAESSLAVPAAEEAGTAGAAGQASSDAGTLAALLGISPQAVIMLAADGRITGWNAAAESMLGWTAAEMLGRDCQCPAAQTAPELFRWLEAVQKGESGEVGEIAITRRDGTAVWLSGSAGPALAADGTGAGMVAVLTDRTEIRQLTRELEESRDKLFTLFGDGNSAGNLRKIVIELK
jgi:PAS domain S-box-containing protein